MDRLDPPPRRQATLNRRAILLAASQGLGNAISRRDTTCDYPGNTKPKFRSDYQRDGP